MEIAPTRILILVLLLVGLAACDEGGDSPNPATLPQFGDPSTTEGCIISTSLFGDGGVGKDGIPALTNPALVPPDEATYLDNNSRVIGIVVEDQAIAIPHNILWWHEIANFNWSNLKLAVTYCPLTGSSMAFDRAAAGNGELGVSGLLYQNNLTMYDRTSQESLWPQMSRQAGCGTRAGTELPMYPVLETTWAGWKALHPNTSVLSGNTGFSRNYTPTGYPYGSYEVAHNPTLLFPIPIDERRQPKERVLGIPALAGGIAFPFFELGGNVIFRVVHETMSGQDIVVLWDNRFHGGMAYSPNLDDQSLTFEVRNDVIIDQQTESLWQVDGRAIDGPLAGAHLDPIAEAYVAFWFAWAAFQPDTRLWTNTE